MPFRHSEPTRTAALSLVDAGCPVVEAANRTGVSWSTLYEWLHDRGTPPARALPRYCWRCAPTRVQPPDPGAYAHLLGLYLGDGHIVRGPRNVYALRIFCADAWPGLADECEQVIRAIVVNRVHRTNRAGCRSISAYSKHWLCYFPQHGPGKKHLRPIVLEPWQLEIVAAHPGRLLRGLFHSDGWRGQNVAVHRRKGETIRYRYPRYEFTNKSEDIRGICTDTLDLLGIAWRPNGRYRISVARRDAVAALDEHVGPKY
jgi:hypothetical protein